MCNFAAPISAIPSIKVLCAPTFMAFFIPLNHLQHLGPARTQFEAVTPPRKPSEGELILFHSVRTALSAIPDRPHQPVNPVVIPGETIGEEGMLVYLLAGTNKDNVAVFGKHYRVLVSNDGQRAVKVEPLTKAVLESELTPPKPGAKPAGLWVTHLLTDYPLETHVFISNLHHLPLLVATENHTWHVTEGKIKLIIKERQ